MTKDHLTELLEPQSGVRECPFCESKNASVQRLGFNNFRDVWCQNCGTSGPETDTDEAAIYAWNTRTTDPTIKSLVELVISLEGALKEISGDNDVDGNSMMCDSHEECQYRAKQALSLVTAFRKGEKI